MRRRHQDKGRLFQRGKIPKWAFMFYEDRVQPDGAVKRVRRTVTLGLVSAMSRRQALAARKPFLDAVNSAPAPVMGRGGKTLRDLIKDWRTYEAETLKFSTLRADESHLGHHIEPRVGDFPLRDLTAKNLQGFANSVAATGVRQKTVVNVLQTLFSILKKASKYGYSVPEVRWKDISLSDDEVPAELAVLTAEQTARIISHAKEPYATMFAVYGMTGLRDGELRGLKIDDLDFDRKLIFIRRTLDQRTRKAQSTKSSASTAGIPMQPALEKRLQAFLVNDHRENSDRYLFVNRNLRPFSRGKVVEYGLWPVQDKLGISRTGLHAFRRGAASELNEEGVQLSAIQKHLRHSDVRTTQRYIHTVGDSQRRAVNVLADKIDRLSAQLESSPVMESSTR